MTDIEFELMKIFKKLSERIKPKIVNRVKTFDIKKGMVIVDYGCGPGMYTYEFSKAVGKEGKVFAVDILEAAKKEIEEIKTKHNIQNVEFILAEGNKSNLAEKTADMIFALDVFHKIENAKEFLGELCRISKIGGTLILDDGHQSREKTKKSLEEIKEWKIIKETGDCLWLTTHHFSDPKSDA